MRFITCDYGSHNYNNEKDHYAGVCTHRQARGFPDQEPCTTYATRLKNVRMIFARPGTRVNRLTPTSCSNMRPVTNLENSREYIKFHRTRYCFSGDTSNAWSTRKLGQTLSAEIGSDSQEDERVHSGFGV